jgi:hypothetical protein
MEYEEGKGEEQANNLSRMDALGMRAAIWFSEPMEVVTVQSGGGRFFSAFEVAHLDRLV